MGQRITETRCRVYTSGGTAYLGDNYAPFPIESVAISGTDIQVVLGFSYFSYVPTVSVREDVCYMPNCHTLQGGQFKIAVYDDAGVKLDPAVVDLELALLTAGTMLRT